MRKQFGARPSKIELEKYSKSRYWNGNVFKNLEETNMDFSWSKMPEFLNRQFFKKNGREAQSLPIIPFDTAAFEASNQSMQSIWYGHSAIFMRFDHLKILIDPMFGSDAAPIAPFKVRRFSPNSLEVIDSFPDIDLVLISHDHYDHLDYDSILKLKQKTKHFYVALGVKRHLVSWGIAEEIITEFNWWEEEVFDDITITFTPTRHFSGRGLRDRAKSLWGGWVLKTNDENIWFSGDSGYGTHFKEIGDRLGPFDFAFMECGQYNENWHQIHMYPEESVQAALDARVQNCMPVHWAGFALAQHSWKEPVERFVEKAESEKLNFIVPAIGSLFNSKTTESLKWWAGF
ncbi:MBL fold metallo-hydrolase [Flavobacterium frigoris]|uniref:Outer membrane protein romA n=1 Tax=Flavobacterium frigoris (strain PS1) TaxID=1086011 RepID=H7FTV1_FLAFP|nr:MBL fold metallo-hydrolase [Flavobacterium frigoris]EIA08092.1 outer membrane protein romA [Flavobacterium frigoris PS1]